MRPEHRAFLEQLNALPWRDRFEIKTRAKINLFFSPRFNWLCLQLRWEQISYGIYSLKLWFRRRRIARLKRQLGIT